MAKKLFIIGNGFDIDLGLKTGYSDFANSQLWEQLMKNTYSGDGDLLADLKQAKETNEWFDIEETIDNYARSATQFGIYEDRIRKDKNDFSSLSSALATYLKEEQQTRRLKKESYASQVLRIVTEVSGVDYYTFNYTSLEKIAADCDIEINPERITHVHGSLENDSIILGILAEPSNQIHEKYSFLYKDNSRFYASNNMYEDFEKADDIIFFGHSIPQFGIRNCS